MNWEDILKVKACGLCYVTAYTYIIEENMKNGRDDLILVHADVTGTGGGIEGVVYGHAFVLDGNTVIDTEQLRKGNTYKFPYDFYKRMGNVTNEKKYTFLEAAKKSIDAGTYGPW